MFLIGTNTYELDERHSETRNVFIPSNSYFKLPKMFYANLTREELLKKLTLELSDFTKSKVFKQSFLADTKEIIFQTTGKNILTQ